MGAGDGRRGYGRRKLKNPPLPADRSGFKGGGLDILVSNKEAKRETETRVYDPLIPEEYKVSRKKSPVFVRKILFRIREMVSGSMFSSDMLTKKSDSTRI